MDFEFHHTIPAPPEDVAEVLLDRKFQSSLTKLGALSERKVLSQKKDSDGLIHRRIRCVLDIDVEGVAKKFIGGADPAWVEEAVWHPEDMVWKWEVHPEVAKELLEASGTISLKPTKTGTKRVVEGQLKVRVPIYGGRVEGWVVEGLKSAYKDEAAHLKDWLESS